MEGALQVTLIEISNVMLESRASASGTFFVTLQVGGSLETSSRRSTPVRAVYVEKFLFDLDAMSPKPTELEVTLHQVLDENRSIELGKARVRIRPGSFDVPVKRHDGTIMCKAQIHFGSPGEVPDTTGYVVHTAPYQIVQQLKSRKMVPIYLAVALLSLIWLARVYQHRFASDEQPYGPLRFKPGFVLRTNEFISGCVGNSAEDCQPMYLHMRPDGNLVLCRGWSPQDNRGVVWQTRTQWLLHSRDYTAQMLEDGQILVQKGSRRIWRNPISRYPQLKGVLTM